MHPLRRFYLSLALTFIAYAHTFGSVTANHVHSAWCQTAFSDTTLPRPKMTPQTDPASRQATKPIILPGTRLDPRFRTIPAQDPAVAKAAPAWLRIKAKGTPMYMLNGHGATAAELRRLQQKQVVSVNVLDGTRAAKLYGQNARNGMVIITTKAGLEPKD